LGVGLKTAIAKTIMAGKSNVLKKKGSNASRFRTQAAPPASPRTLVAFSLSIQSHYSLINGALERQYDTELT